MSEALTQQRLASLEHNISMLIDCLLGSGSARPGGDAANLAIGDDEVRTLLVPEQRAIAIRMRVCPEVAHEQIAWTMLLAAQQARCDGRPLSTTAICSFAYAPATTALRWLDLLVTKGLLTSNPDPSDARRRWIALSAKGVLMFKRYAAELQA